MRAAVATTILLTACVAPERVGQRLEPGTWVEARGRIEDGRPIVVEVARQERTADDKPDKVELLGPVTAATAATIDMLGVPLHPDPDTEYEDSNRKPAAPFVPAGGDWLRVKARDKGDSIRARSIRRSESKGSFRVTGELRRYDDDRDQIDIGGVVLPVSSAVDIGFGGGRSADDPLSLFLADDQKSVPFTIRVDDHLRLGGQVSVNPDKENDYNLDSSTPRDRNKLTVEAKVDALWLIGDSGSYGLFEVTTGRIDSYHENSSNEYRRDEELEISRAYASVRVLDSFQILVGRQDFLEERRWLYDEVLDAVRVIVPAGPFEFQAGAATGRAVAAENNPTEDTRLFETTAEWHIERDWKLSAYVLKRLDDTSFDHEPLLYGVRSYSRKSRGLSHWLELGGASGHSTFGDPNATPSTQFRADLLGFAVDAGAVWTFGGALHPTVAVGYAIGTGAGRDAVKQGYRQSGYNDNNAKLGGVTSVHYYGEVLRPELGNIGIATLAGAIRPTADSSVSLLYHHYEQDTPTTFSPSTSLRTNPNGIFADLGDEVDIVLAYRIPGQLTAELTLGHFEPGPAFDNQDPAERIELTVRFSF